MESFHLCGYFSEKIVDSFHWLLKEICDLKNIRNYHPQKYLQDTVCLATTVFSLSFMKHRRTVFPLKPHDRPLSNTIKTVQETKETEFQPLCIIQLQFSHVPRFIKKYSASLKLNLLYVRGNSVFLDKIL